MNPWGPQAKSEYFLESLFYFTVVSDGVLLLGGVVLQSYTFYHDYFQGLGGDGDSESVPKVGYHLYIYWLWWSNGLMGFGFCLFPKTFLNASIKFLWQCLNIPGDRVLESFELRRSKFCALVKGAMLWTSRQRARFWYGPSIDEFHGHEKVIAIFCNSVFSSIKGKCYSTCMIFKLNLGSLLSSCHWDRVGGILGPSLLWQS